MKNKIIISGAIALAFVVGVTLTTLVTNAVKKEANSTLGSGEGAVATQCNVSTVTASLVGNQFTTNLLATSSRRTWARIERVDDSSGVATNTVHVSFDEGAAATTASGLTLATTTQFIDFGLNTDFPYVGIVTGITDTGSTTVRVTQCAY